jgi:uncharacterized membrane protein
MMTSNERRTDSARVVVTTVAAISFLVWTWTSYARWSDFQYRSFDLAYYVQAIWQLIHGRFDVSVENVPLLGNHVEPIVFLFAPLLAIFRHPMVFVAVQNATLSAMGPVGSRMAKRLGFDDKRACLLATAILLAPATGYIALHEFHPEALTAPFLLFMLQARLTKSLARYWVWLVAVLACKENMAPLLVVYCIVLFIAERDRTFAERRRWYLWPMAVAMIWFIFCTRVITPTLNSGNIDYLGLYDRLGTSPANILVNAILHPQLLAHSLFESLTHGNLFWGLLFPFLCLPLLRLRWILIATPVLLQHLLSWRSAEWMIYFHYGAPLLPLFWFASVEAIAAFNDWKVPAVISRITPSFVVVACVIGQFWLGLLSSMISRNADWFESGPERARKNAFVAQIPPASSIVAPLPYLSHLAMREKLYSLHYILKGLKTLSRSSYEPPPPTDFVLLDYRDTATFDPGAGFYHPTMKTTDGRIIPSSDRLLYDFLKRATWTADSQDELTLLRNTGGATTALASTESSTTNQAPVFAIGATSLLAIKTGSKAVSPPRLLEIHLHWKFEGQREIFPWMVLRLSRDQQSTIFVKGLCAPEVREGVHVENWSVTTTELSPGDYALEALFLDNSKQGWSQSAGHGQASNLLAPPVPLGHLKVQ